MRKSIAIHEAGHAVVGRVLGLRGGSAPLVPDPAVEVGTQDDPWELIGVDELLCVRAPWMVFRARILTLIAGGEAERELLGATAVEDGEDRVEIARLVAAPESELRDCWFEYEPRMRAQVRRIIRRYRREVESVAAALMERTRLSPHQDIDALV